LSEVTTTSSQDRHSTLPTTQVEALYKEEDKTQEEDNTNSSRQNTETSQTEEPSSQRRPPAMNTINLRTDDVFGQDLQLPKPPGVKRFLSLNINGIRQANEFQDALETAQALNVSGIDFWNFQETTLNWRSECLAQCYEIQTSLP
jgi:hypothetical protein